MKKFLVLTLAAAALLVSCNKEGKTRITYETPIYSSLAVKYEVVNDDFLNLLLNQDKVSSFELTENGDFVIVDKNGTHTGPIGNIDEIKDKAKDAPKSIECTGWGKVDLEFATKADPDLTITFKPKSGVPFVLSANIVNPSTSVNQDFLKKLVRKWTITYTTVSVSGGDLGDKLAGGVNCNGCDLAKIKSELERVSGKTFDMGDVSGYVVDYVEVTGAGSFIVKFTNGEAVSADINLTTPSADKATFEYEVSGAQAGVSIFYGKANGEINFDKKGNCEFVLNAKVDHSNDAYKGKVVFKVKKID